MQLASVIVVWIEFLRPSPLTNQALTMSASHLIRFSRNIPICGHRQCGMSLGSIPARSLERGKSIGSSHSGFRTNRMCAS